MAQLVSTASLQLNSPRELLICQRQNLILLQHSVMCTGYVGFLKLARNSRQDRVAIAMLRQYTNGPDWNILLDASAQSFLRSTCNR
jgi:hypothetical protein